MTLQVAVFGRVPRAGRCKTRLIPALGGEAAASLYAAFLRDTLERVQELANLRAQLWLASADQGADALPPWLPSSLERRLQQGADLGARMRHALEDLGASEGGALVLGSDAPTLPAAHLRAARDALAHADVVLGPCADGGYYLVAARATHPAMFAGARFSTRHALADTEHSCRAAGLTTRRLPAWYDVDTPADLALLQAHLALEPTAARHTARWFAGRGKSAP